ncbi:MAG TPA: hypothetical protein VJS39_06725, partial [Gemmatimonadaceae bacterium]|nr:hypothetical protein [Gemmatimonadaceae bacterium]
MNERVPSAVAVVSSLVIIAYACTSTQTTTNTNPAPTGSVATNAQVPGGPGGRGGFRGPLTDSARRVRDSLTSARRDSGAAGVMRMIAGRENQ